MRKITSIKTVRLVNSAIPFKFHHVEFPQQAGLENNKMCLSYGMTQLE